MATNRSPIPDPSLPGGRCILHVSIPRPFSVYSHSLTHTHKVTFSFHVSFVSREKEEDLERRFALLNQDLRAMMALEGEFFMKVHSVDMYVCICCSRLKEPLEVGWKLAVFPPPPSLHCYYFSVLFLFPFRGNDRTEYVGVAVTFWGEKSQNWSPSISSLKVHYHRERRRTVPNIFFPFLLFPILLIQFPFPTSIPSWHSGSPSILSKLEGTVLQLTLTNFVYRHFDSPLK